MCLYLRVWQSPRSAREDFYEIHNGGVCECVRVTVYMRIYGYGYGYRSAWKRDEQQE